MKFDIFGRKVMEIVRHDDQWLAFYCGCEGKKRKAVDLVIPAQIKESELEGYLADIFHEWATPSHSEIKRIVN